MDFYEIRHKSFGDIAITISDFLYNRLMNDFENNDYIEWYNDGENVFIGECNLFTGNVITAIKKRIGKFDADFWMAGEL